MLTTVVDHYPKIKETSAVNLKQARSDFEDNKITLAEYEKIQNQVTAETILEQEQSGIDLITDGQIKWDDQQTYFTNKIQGFERGDLIRYFDTNFLYRRPILKTKPEKTSNFVTDDFIFAKTLAQKPLKAVLIGPYSLAKFCLDEYYKNQKEFTLALADFLADEIRTLENAGAEIIQINEPWIVQPEANFDLFNKALTKLLNVRTKAKIFIYTWFGKIDAIWTKLIKLPVELIGIDLCRYPENFDYLVSENFPADKSLGAGLIDAQNTMVESKEEIKQKIQQLSQKIEISRVYLNPSAGLEYLPRNKAFQKLKLIADIKGALT